MNQCIDVCKLLGNYNDKDVYLYMSSKYNQIQFSILLIIIYYQNGLKTQKN